MAARRGFKSTYAAQANSAASSNNQTARKRLCQNLPNSLSSRLARTTMYRHNTRIHQPRSLIRNRTISSFRGSFRMQLSSNSFGSSGSPAAAERRLAPQTEPVHFPPDPPLNSSVPDNSTTTDERPRHDPKWTQHPDETSESNQT